MSDLIRTVERSVDGPFGVTDQQAKTCIITVLAWFRDNQENAITDLFVDAATNWDQGDMSRHEACSWFFDSLIKKVEKIELED